MRWSKRFEQPGYQRRAGWLPACFSLSITARCRKLAILALLAIASISLAAFSGGLVGIFRPFRDLLGLLQSLPNGSSLDKSNAFFDSSLGTNRQACSTCHQPDQGFSVTVDYIDRRFIATNGLDPLFRPDDTADRPDADVSTLQARTNAYRLFLELGVGRIGKTFKGNTNPDNLMTTQSDFRVEHQDTPQFGPLPTSSDPQHPGIPSLSLFRRPLVNSNMNFDSAVLWDGRDKINTLATSQVPKAIQSLLLGSGTDTNANQQIAEFMTGVFTDQILDLRVGSLSARGAEGGVKNLLALSFDPLRPCLYEVAFPQIAGFPTPGTPTRTPFSPSTCTKVDDSDPHTFGADLFDAWANLPNDGNSNGADAERAAIARGQEIFNTVVLHQPPDLDGKLLDVGSTANGGANADHPDRIPAGAPIHCVNCHASHNLGNNPTPNFIGRIGTDSIDILENLVATRSTLDPLVKNVLENVRKLPVYCLRPNSDATPFTGPSGVACGSDPVNHPGDVRTTDPGRAMVTGLIADAGKFKPPILRNLAVRAPFFHAGTAKTVFEVIDFYDARFQIDLTQQQKRDLAKFLLAY